MTLTLEVWRQDGHEDAGKFVSYPLDGVSPEMSFLEMLDLLNEQLQEKGEDPVTFEHDCREGICGMCGFVINGQAHGFEPGTTVCQLHMRKFPNGAKITLEPWRATAFPVLKDLAVDRSALDRIIEAGGYVSVRTGSAPDAHAIPIAKADAEVAMDAAACIGCGACVAACKNSSAMLFTSAKAGHLGALPQGQVEKRDRALAMMAQHDLEGFGSCTNTQECEAACPKEISIRNIAAMNRTYMRARLPF
ncbi:MAG: succinate dehydrogenase/fumarate reductase iron-sulfur subunit [Planctomycetes bacterium]|nr:succinate dehydrogenase/fumarate reductase iron-sulfur subunit [Planctomycetota bacterium]